MSVKVVALEAMGAGVRGALLLSLKGARGVVGQDSRFCKGKSKIETQTFFAARKMTSLLLPFSRPLLRAPARRLLAGASRPRLLAGPSHPRLQKQQRRQPHSAAAAGRRRGGALEAATLAVRPVAVAAAVTGGSFAAAVIANHDRRWRAGLEWAVVRYLPREMASFLLENPGRSVVYGIIGLNVGVFLLWQRRLATGSMSGLLDRFFMSSPLSGRGLPLLLNTFSHQSLVHLGFNMFALHSFGTVLVSYLGPAHFLALYLSGGVLSSLGSTLLSIARRSAVPSLGASGAILTLASTFACINPDASFSLIFLPAVVIPAQAAIAGIATLDLVGLLAGWRFFDHGAHLAGVAVGAGYVLCGGHEVMRAYQRKVLRQWHEFNKRSKKNGDGW